MLTLRRRQPLSIGDFERLARRRLPRVLFETIESGVEDELCLETNRQAFRQHRFVPRACVDVAVRSQAMTLFGVEHRSPFGIAPTGIAGTFRRNAELFLARAAAEAGVPFILSGACMVPMEAVAAISPATTWFQLYPARDQAIATAMVGQAEAAGIAGLVLTIDNPVSPNRERDRRNGFALPLRMPLPMLLEALTHPAWIARYLLDGGLPMMEIWRPHARPGAGAGEVAQFFRSQSPTIQTWRDLERYRRLWPRKLVLKGVMHPDDAVRAADLGIDGIIISNHGGKALDRVPSPLEMLPAIRGALPAKIAVMIDSGIRRGSDVVVARSLGADFVFAGRATLYAVAARGEAGAKQAIAILKDEIDRTLALVGCASFARLGSEFLHDAPDDAGPAASWPTLAAARSRAR